MSPSRGLRWPQGVQRWIPISASVLLATTAVVAPITWGGWSLGVHHSALSDPAAVVGAAVAVISFLLVLLGTAVAVAAYMCATGTPDLELEVRFPNMDTNDLAFEVQKFEESRYPFIP